MAKKFGKTILDGEKFSPTTRVSGDVVDATRTVRMAKNSNRQTMHVELNFENVVRDDLMLLAAKSLVIDVQSAIRAGDMTFDEWIDVAEFIKPKQRKARKMKPMTAQEMAVLVGKMSDEERKEFFAQMAANAK